MRMGRLRRERPEQEIAVRRRARIRYHQPCDRMH